VRITTAVPGGDPGLRRRVADALRSANAVAPVVGPGEPLPGLPRAVLAGGRACAGPA
jgi:hypothetical protein